MRVFYSTGQHSNSSGGSSSYELVSYPTLEYPAPSDVGSILQSLALIMASWHLSDGIMAHPTPRTAHGRYVLVVSTSGA